jgi:NAD(P)-dependent dehydrogenase (short-subunit alcohol dehydrogenase family)
MSLTPSPRRLEVLMDKELEGQSVLITGSTHGIGRAMATLFAQEGANVVITGRSRDEGRALEEEIDGSGGRSLFVPMDVTIEADVQNAVAAAVAAFGGLTTLVNNAAWVQGSWGADGPVTEIALEDWEKIIRVNLTGSFLASKYALPEIVRSGGGSVLNIASTAAIQGRPGMDGYSASKGALVSLTRSMAAYYSRYAVRVNCLAVGFIDTGEPALKALLDDESFGPMVRSYYMGRIGTPADVAYTAAHLISDRGSYFTGSVVVADFGATGVGHMDIQVPDMPGFPSDLQVDSEAASRRSVAGQT